MFGSIYFPNYSRCSEALAHYTFRFVNIDTSLPDQCLVLCEMLMVCLIGFVFRI